MVVALNMMDVARTHGLQIDVQKLAAELGLPVVETVAIDNSLFGNWLSHWWGRSIENGREALLHAAGQALENQALRTGHISPLHQTPPDQLTLQKQINHILSLVTPLAPRIKRFNHHIDAVVMHPVWGLVLLAALLLMVFQAVFSWANVPMDAIKEVMAAVGDFIRAQMPQGMLRSLLVDGVVAGVGSVVVFLPQILILFFFVLLLEDSGYLPRAAFLLDNVMGKVGLSGRAFIPVS